MPFCTAHVWLSGLPLGGRVFGNSKRGDYSPTMRYMIAKKHSIVRKK